MLSNASKYAIRAILYLAQNSSFDNKIGAKTIADELETPQAFLAKILKQLSANQLIASTKGPHGGFYLTDQNKSIYLWDVIVCIDGGHKFDQCFFGLSKCDNENPCPIHHIAFPFKASLLTHLKGKTISDLIEDIKNEGTVISLKGF